MRKNGKTDDVFPLIYIVPLCFASALTLHEQNICTTNRKQNIHYETTQK